MEPSHSSHHFMNDLNDGSDRPRITKLINEHYSGLINLVGGAVRSIDLAAEMVHQAIVITLEHIKAGRIGSTNQVPGHVYGICTRLLRNYRRSMSNRADLRVDSEHLATMASDEQVNLSDEQRIKECVVLALRSLSSRDRDVVTRFYLYDEDKGRICRDFNLSPILFNKIISRARQRVRMLLASVPAIAEKI
jgi:RNA polymerase sigma-70 factor (ECF subfamily)